jgi:hypothetical protein
VPMKQGFVGFVVQSLCTRVSAGLSDETVQLSGQNQLSAPPSPDSIDNTVIEESGNTLFQIFRHRFLALNGVEHQQVAGAEGGKRRHNYFATINASRPEIIRLGQWKEDRSLSPPPDEGRAARRASARFELPIVFRRWSKRVLFGSSGRIRTYNPSVNSRMLYR